MLVDPNPHVQARNLVLLNILLREDENAVIAFTRALYSLHLDAKTFHLVKNVLEDILQGWFQNKGTYLILGVNFLRHNNFYLDFANWDWQNDK